jgi:hypothetical protein
LVGIKYEQLMPLVLRIKMLKNAFRISGDFVVGWNRNRSYVTDFGADDAKVAKEAVPQEIPPMLVMMPTG